MAAELFPDRPTLKKLAEAVQGCTACELYKDTTQAVFGEGSNGAEVMFVGEQPGDQEDLKGRPFVGPAGKLLDQALDEAGIDRDQVYVTNVVKHFNFEPRGKRRIHKKPNAEHIAACRPWLEAEIEQVKPEVIVCLGATAAQAILGGQGLPSARPTLPLPPRPERDRHGPPVVDPASPRRRGQTRGHARVRGGSGSGGPSPARLNPSRFGPGAQGTIPPT